MKEAYIVRYKVKQLAREISALKSASYNEAARLVRDGSISERAFDWYCLAWHWMNWRLSSNKQAKFYDRMGKEAFIRRMERVQSLMNRKILALEKSLAELN